MRIGQDDFFHLTYCTNIHPGNGWMEVERNLRSFAPSLRQELAPGRPFGIGLRLSARESEELLEEDRLARFEEFLRAQGLYVFTLNGFPYGSFHHEAVKSSVFAPDWRTAQRLTYTLRLARILAALLPEGVSGGISTVPLSYKPWLSPPTEGDWEVLTRHLMTATACLARMHGERGRFIHLDLEPEPGGLIETSREIVWFFETWLLPLGVPLLARELGVSRPEAERLLRAHLQVCWDTCHLAIEYEDPQDVLARLDAAGIGIGKVQLSAALRVLLPPGDRGPLHERLLPFAESTYLHQVIERRVDGTLRGFPDLTDALPHLQDPGAEEWRIHYHVPLFVEAYDLLGSTQPDTLRVLGLLRERRFTQQLEIETYTWSLLPPPLKQDLSGSIAAEYRWVLGHLTPGEAASRPGDAVREGRSHA